MQDKPGRLNRVENPPLLDKLRGQNDALLAMVLERDKEIAQLKLELDWAKAMLGGRYI